MMHKLAVLSALALASSARTGLIYYNGADYPCIEWNESGGDFNQGGFDAGATVDDIAEADSLVNANGVTYMYAFDVTLEGFDVNSNTQYYCDMAFVSASSVEWEVTSGDEEADSDMFTVKVTEWPTPGASNNWHCRGPSAYYSNYPVASGDTFEADYDTVCAYDVWFEYNTEYSTNLGADI